MKRARSDRSSLKKSTKQYKKANTIDYFAQFTNNKTPRPVKVPERKVSLKVKEKEPTVYDRFSNCNACNKNTLLLHGVCYQCEKRNKHNVQSSTYECINCKYRLVTTDMDVSNRQCRGCTGQYVIINSTTKYESPY